IEAELVIERGVDRGRGRDHEKRIAVGGHLHDGLGGDIACGARPVLDDELLAEPLGEPLPHQAREDVGRAAGGEADDKPHRPRRIALRRRDARRGSQRGGTGGQMQKCPTGKFHNVPPNVPRGYAQETAVARTALRLNLYGREMTRKGSPRRLGTTELTPACPPWSNSR